MFSVKHAPKAVKGYLDLSHGDFDKRKHVKLDGEWLFYWSRLLSPQEVSGASGSAEYLAVPSSWHDHEVAGQPLPDFGYATYSLTVKLPAAHGPLAIKIPSAASAYTLWVNNELIASNGIVSGKRDSSKPQFVPVVRVLNSNDSLLHVVVQVSNYFHSRGGLWESITIGNAQKMVDGDRYKTAYDYIVTGGLIILFIYHFLIFFLRRSEYTAVAVGLTCLAMALQLIFTGERVMYKLIPSFNVHLGLRIEYFSVFMIVFCVGLFQWLLFTKDFSIRVLTAIGIITIVEFGLIFFTKPQFFTSQLTIDQIIWALADVYFLFVLIRAMINKRTFATFIFVIYLLMTLAFANDFLYEHQLINTFFTGPFIILLFIRLQAFLVAHKITNAFRNIEVLAGELNTANVNLEQKVYQRTKQLADAKKKSDDLLSSVLPVYIADELKKKGNFHARVHEHVTVMVTDFKDFNNMSRQLSAVELIEELDTCFKAFDDILSSYNVEKIKSFGDSYLAATGLDKSDHFHAERMVHAALEIRDFVNERKKELGPRAFDIRIGIHSGAVIAGIVGARKLSYDIWGDTVNFASQMEETCVPGAINISETTFALIKDSFTCTFEGGIVCRNGQKLDRYYVVARNATAGR